jgi:preprotein translocase subunit SecF
MMFKRAINFIRLRWIFIGFSILVIVAGVVGYVANGGFNLGIDFTSGLSQQFVIDPAAAKVGIAQLRATLAPLGRFDLQVVGNPQNQEFLVKVQAPKVDSEFQNRTEAQIHDLLAAAYGADSIKVTSSDFVGPRYSGELATQTIWILLVAILGILIYAGIRFQLIYGTAAVITTVHDALFMVGVTALFRIEFTTTTVAALLTIIGYSINDTIVIFDRVRENRGLMRDAELGTILNTSITQTMSRTILTSLTTMMAILALLFLTKGDIHNFALLMVVGIVEGTYSTIFVASPIVYMWTGARDRGRKARDLSKYGRGLAPAAQSRAAPAEAEVQPVEAGDMGRSPLEAAEGEEAGEAAEEELPAGVVPAAGAAPPPQSHPAGVQGPPRANSSSANPPGVQPAVPQETGSAAGGYIRVQRRHKKRKR